MTNQTKLDYSPSGPFYKMVVAYKAAIGGLVIFRSEFKEIRQKLNSVGIGSKIHGALSFPYSEMDELYKSDELTQGMITDSLAFMLINTAFEAVKQSMSRSNPMHQFFRHLRNAASHGGTFNFHNNEPRYPANWRDREIIEELHGKSIWSPNLSPGDFLILLNDIEADIR